MESLNVVSVSRNVRVARWIFLVAGIYGMIVLGAMFFWTPPIMPRAPWQQPEMYFGFAGVGLAWQVVFLMIAAQPIRFRPLMLVAGLLEKLGFAMTLAVLVVRHRAGHHWIPVGVIESIIGAAFLVGYWITSPA